LRGLDYHRNAGIKPTAAQKEAIETVIERHQNGRAAQSPSSNIFHGDGAGVASFGTHCALCGSARWYNNAT
jgi:hypothetical protein